MFHCIHVVFCVYVEIAFHIISITLYSFFEFPVSIEMNVYVKKYISKQYWTYMFFKYIENFGKINCLNQGLTV